MSLVRPAVAGMKGFDVDQRVGPQAAKALAANGYSFAVRYLPRVTQGMNDLTATEVCQLLAGGLAVMAVQHVESETSWVPSAEKGEAYGSGAARAAKAVGLPAGVTVWLDLEGVAEGTDAAVVVAYCQAWYAMVADAGYEPGLYFGWHAGLTGEQLYHALSFARFWAAYNADGDQYPTPRGACMRQRLAEKGEFTGYLELDVNTVQADALGGLPTLLAPR